MQITKLFNCTQQEFDSAKSSDHISLTCSWCNQSYNRLKRNIFSKGTPKYCSNACQGAYRSSSITVEILCKNCNQSFVSLKRDLKKLNTNRFCTKSCAASFNNKNKSHGTRRSKFEVQLETILTREFPNLSILYSDKTTIKSELDIYIPSLKLAFEIQGIFHYEPIFGQEKLDQIQNNDKLKKEACVSEGIDLVLIDISKLKRCTVNTVIPYNTQVLNTINTHPGLIHISDYSLKVGIKS